MGPSVNVFYEMTQGHFLASAPNIPVISSLNLDILNEQTDLVEHVCRHLFVRKVRFQDSINELYRKGVRRFIEVGGRKALTGLTQDILKNIPDVVIIPTDNPKAGGISQLKLAIEAAQSFGLSFESSSSPNFSPSVLESLGDDQLLTSALILLDELKRRKLGSFAIADSVPAAVPPTSKDAEQVREQVLGIYVKATEYPVEVLELDVDLESELGLDSVKQLQILSKIQEHFVLPPLSNLQIKNYNTIRKVIKMVLDA
jgi:malonyl CoA-acyl carrier protein transacylase